MNKVFDPGELEFADTRGDPCRVIEIQRKVKELLEANLQRQEGIKEEIREEGAWAIPGLINATYVWTRELKNEQSQDMLADLMVELAQHNLEAANLIFVAGILETPFPIPRYIACRALSKLKWKATGKQVEAINKKIKESEKLQDLQTILALYLLLLPQGNESDLTRALQQCKKWAQKPWKEAGNLLDVMLYSFPNQTDRILTDVLLAVHDNYNDKTTAEVLLDSLGAIPATWLSEGILSKVSTSVLSQMRPPRHKTIEYLWEYAVEDYKQHDPQSWAESLEALGKQIRQATKQAQPDVTASIYRYWFEALGWNGDIRYIAEQTRSDAMNWALAAAIQLFFHQKDMEARQALEDLEAENRQLHCHAKEEYDKTKTGTPRPRREPGKTGGPTAPKRSG